MSNIYDTLNPPQKEAVLTTEGPVLVLAGAGSGKTRALTHRIAYLIAEKQVKPWNILAITFTNKAAGEMRSRVDELTGESGASVWVATFHSTCVRILRRYADYLGYTTSFSIYDTDDQKTLMKQIIKKLDLDPKQYRERAVLGYISTAKNELKGPDEFEHENLGDFRMRHIAEAYHEYQRQLLENNAMDFDDLLFNAVELFRNNPDVLEEYQERFRYIMVDEYQDTNMAQFRLVSLLAAKYRNLCVVGDDDQSIYKFRGADITNILDFEKAFPGAKVIRLEQNYRSTKSILDTANAVIRHNFGRKEKTLWTENEQGPKVGFRTYNTAYDEADGIVRDILQNRDKFPYSSCAVLYRTNAQSRMLEEKCITYNIPYRLVGGVNFYQRKEIKDLICYLKTVDNGRDEIAVQRIINVPRRGIGAASINRIADHAERMGMGFYDALADCEHAAGLNAGARKKITGFVNEIEVFRSRAAELTVKDLLENILDETGYRKELESEETVEAQSRLENIEELLNKAADLGDSPEDTGALGRFLEEVALVAEVDALDESEERIVLMTLHSAKGLEFPKVYLAGMEDGLFPSNMSINSDDPTDVEEERRLCYVGITRAREELIMTCARSRMVNGETRYSRASRFVDEIPRSMLESRQPSEGGRGFRFGGYTGEETTAGSEVRTGSSFGRGGYGSDKSGYGFGESRFGRSGYGSGSSFGRSREGFGDNGGSSYSYNENPRGAGSGSGTLSTAFDTKGYTLGKNFTIDKEQGLNYGEGDRVRHRKFGDGTVLKVEEGKRDYEVTVDFDSAGEKHLFASFAKLQKLPE